MGWIGTRFGYQLWAGWPPVCFWHLGVTMQSLPRQARASHPDKSPTGPDVKHQGSRDIFAGVGKPLAECPEVSAAAGAQNRCWQRQRHPSKGWIAFSLVRSGLDSHQVFLACMGWIALAAEACLLEWANLCHTSASPVSAANAQKW